MNQKSKQGAYIPRKLGVNFKFTDSDLKAHELPAEVHLGLAAVSHGKNVFGNN